MLYRLGQIIAGLNRSGGTDGPPNRDFPQNFSGQQPPGGEFPRPTPGAQTQNGEFPSRRVGGETNRIAEMIQSGQMPPANYTILHPSAKLSSEERQQLIQGLQKTLK